MSARSGLRKVADALTWYGEASTDQLAVELGLGRTERPALEAAILFWVERGDAREVLPEVSVAGGCARGCGGCRAAEGKSSRAGRAAGAMSARVWSWVGSRGRERGSAGG